MMRGRGETVKRAAPIAALALLAGIAPAALAQSVNGWSLPPASSGNPAPNAQGPVDAQNPVVRPAGPDSAGPSPAPSASPAIVATPAPPLAPVLAAPDPETRPAPPPMQKRGANTNTAAQAPAAAPAAPSPTPEAIPLPTASAVPEASTPVPAAASAGDGAAWPWWWWAIPAAFAALVLGALLWRHRRRTPAEDRWEEPEYAQEPTVPVPEAEQTVRREAPSPLPDPAFMPPTKAARAMGLLEFQPVVLRLSLVYATLQYRLRLTAQTDIPQGKLLGSMISAHASLPHNVQLAPPAEALELLQAIPPMATGQTLDLEGELRLPLGAVRPLQQAGAAFMVPLVQLALLGDDEASLPRLELGCVFTVGIPGSGPTLAPLRIDTGPRDFATLAAREIETARRTVLLPLDPARAAG